MAILKNKHILTAALISPVLAILAYYAIDAIISDPPQAAVEGESYVLVEKPNCRYSSGSCGLKNGDFELDFSTEPSDSDQIRLVLKSVFPLEGVKMAVAEKFDEKPPLDMLPLGEDRLLWSLEIKRPNPNYERIYLVASANRSLYFGDVATKFIANESTTDNED